MAEEIKRFVTVKTYAALSGVSVQAIYARIESGTLELVEFGDVEGQFIDLKNTPPKGKYEK
jgi:hypothetical protein